MWMLVVLATVWVQGTGSSVDTYSFSPPLSQDHCNSMKKWVDDRETASKNETKTTTQCVFIGNK
jgi:hypothetical protein